MIGSLFFSLLKGTLQPFRRMMPVVPVFNFVNNRIEDIKGRTNEKIEKAKGTALRGGIFVLSIGIIVWLAIFIYIAFYYTYMPSLTHSRPVYVQFKTCDDKESSICSFPTAHIQLTRRQQLLMVGQSYKIFLSLEMPESEANKKLGMFMVCLELSDKDGLLVANSCRPVMLHYRSWLMHIIKTLIYSPLFILGTSEEKQLLTVEMFSDFEEDQNRPITDMYVEIQTKKIELYSSNVLIHAHFTGLRYLMFHWPILSAIVGVGVNLFLIIFTMLLSWHHLFNKEGTAYHYTQIFRERIHSLKGDELQEKKSSQELEEIPSETEKALCPDLEKSIVPRQVFIAKASMVMMMMDDDIEDLDYYKKS